ncbi:GumC family protein [Pseudomonas sp. Marseille-QA0892]
MNSPVRTDLPWQVQSSEDDSDYIDLKRIWRAIWSRKLSILSLVAIITMLAALVVMSMAPTYRGTSSVMIESRNNQVINFQPTYDAGNQISEYLQTQLGLIKSRGVAERVVRELNLTEHPDLDPRQQPAPLIDFSAIVSWVRNLFSDDEFGGNKAATEAEIFDHVVNNLMARTSATIEGKSQLVYISVDMGDSLSAAAAANSIAQNYIDSQLEAQMEMSMSSSNWMNGRLTELRASLQEAEDRLQAYREAEGLVDVGGVSTISANELSLTGDRMIDAARQRAEAQSQYDQVRRMESLGWERLASVPAVLGHPLIQQFKAEQARARAQVEEVSRRYGDRHPAMVAARTELSAATASLKAQVEQVVAGIERNYQLAAANEQSLRASFNKNKDQIQDISRKEFKLRELQRDVDSNRQLYDTFMTRLRETAATADMGSTNARIVDKAIPPAKPAAPNKQLIIAVAFALSLIIGIIAALALDVLNNTFKSTDDIESKLNLPVLGILPLVNRKQAKQVQHLFEKGEDKRFCEAVRTIRTSMTLADMNSPKQVVVVTSSVPGEGKSSVAANLAFAMGQLHKVLLIDADMRRPTIAKAFDFPAGTPGLANLMAGTAKADDCIRTVGSIDILPAGVVPPNPLELLASPRFAKFLEMAKGHYERIIIDSPPSQAVSDSVLLSTIADSVVYVVKSEATSIPLVQRSIGQLLQNNASITGVILNQVDIKKAAKYGKYVGYYDHHGYSEAKA